jgi:hypothetical protein
MGIQHARLGAERLWKENQPLGYQALGPTVKRWLVLYHFRADRTRELTLGFHVQTVGWVERSEPHH